MTDETTKLKRAMQQADAATSEAFNAWQKAETHKQPNRDALFEAYTIAGEEAVTATEAYEAAKASEPRVWMGV